MMTRRNFVVGAVAGLRDVPAGDGDGGLRRPHHAGAARLRVRAFDFQVDCESRISGVVRTVASSRVYSPNALLPAEKDVAPVACRFAEEAIPGCGEVRFTVRPVNEWGKFGVPLATDWMDFAKQKS